MDTTIRQILLDARKVLRTVYDKGSFHQSAIELGICDDGEVMEYDICKMINTLDAFLGEEMSEIEREKYLKEELEI